MRYATGSLVTAATLLLGGAAGALAPWALAAGAAVLLVSAVIGAIAAEERDPRSAERLLWSPKAIEEARPVSTRIAVQLSKKG